MARENEVVTRNRQAADAGDPTAQFNLGNMYRLGYQVERDVSLAVKWLLLAARQNHAEAASVLRRMAAEGIPIEAPVEAPPPPLGLARPEPDPDPLILPTPPTDPAVLRPEAEAGDPAAQVALGNLLRPTDPRQALRWYAAAAELNDARGQYALGVMHDLGEGVARDDRKAFGWYRKAAAQGLTEAQFNLGNMIRSG
ncbi:MAG: sel1 repeat family protein, partial [Alphaproteobacteria bacterium]|nr:sel1 repeat family protein [Alphaproteobacteria bacterium]